ncbi:hypothetical protein KJ853_03685 [Patescibacteria group bacterium]|nr:hypothetical protein [Patescibacteria group bacterium]
MQIDLNREQFLALVRYLASAGYIYGLLGDIVDDKFKKQSDETDELENYLLRYAKDFDCEKIVDEFEGKKFLSEKENDKILDDISEYDEYAFWSELANRLAKRDFFRTHSQQEIEKMDDFEIMHKQAEIEDKYWEELEKKGIEKFELRSY